MAAGKKKKNLITLLGMTAVLALLVVGYLAASSWKKNEEENGETEEPDIVLLSLPKEEIASIEVKSKEFPFTILAGESGWEFAGDAEFDVSAGTADAMKEKLAQFTAETAVLADAEDLAEYGLEEPEFTVTATLKDGSSRAVRLGDPAGAGAGYYACTDGSRDVYVVSEEVRGAFAGGQDALLEKAAVPEFTAEKATGLKLSGDAFPPFTVAKNTGEQAELMGIYQYSLLLTGVYPVPVTVDFTAFSELMKKYVGMSLGELVSYHEQDKQQYGLDRPETALTVTYTDAESSEDREFTVHFGGMNETQTHRYVCLEGSGQTFMMEQEKAEELLAADTFALVDRYTQMVNITLIGGMNIAYGDTVRRVDITHNSETGETGQEVVTDYITVDGKSLNEEEDDEVRTLYQEIIALKLTRELTEEDVIGEEPVLVLEFLDKDGAGVLRSVRYLKLKGSGQELAVEVDGVCLFAADGAAVEELTGLLKDYRP